MARLVRQVQAEETTMPAALETFDRAMWVDDDADDATELASIYGKARARHVLRQHRWRERRREWVNANNTMQQQVTPMRKPLQPVPRGTTTGLTRSDQQHN